MTWLFLALWFCFGFEKTRREGNTKSANFKALEKDSGRYFLLSQALFLGGCYCYILSIKALEETLLRFFLNSF